MGILAGTRSPRRSDNGSGRWVMVPREVTVPQRRRSRVIARRRQTFQRLLGFAFLTFLPALIPATRWMVFVNLAADLALAGYVVQLRQWKKEEESAIAHSSRIQPVALAPVQAAPVSGSLIAASVPPPPQAAPAELADELVARLISQTG